MDSTRHFVYHVLTGEGDLKSIECSQSKEVIRNAESNMKNSFNLIELLT